MRPGDRIELIKRCAKRLSKIADWSEIDFILRQFHLGYSDEWEPNPQESPDAARFRYVRDMISGDGINDADLVSLDEYLRKEPDSDPGDEPWKDGAFRLFLTHVAAQKAVAKSLKAALGQYGIDAFVAHEDIEPGPSAAHNPCGPTLLPCTRRPSS